jgi:uncharacterized protein YjbJ (UPF0337 family)
MSTDDKIRNAAQKAKGAVKETTGKVTRDRSLEAEGRVDKAKADLKQAGEKVKDSLRD